MRVQRTLQSATATKPDEELRALGFSDFFDDQLEATDESDWIVVRVGSWDGPAGEVVADAAYPAELSGKLRLEPESYPATGDWALAQQVEGRCVLQRLLRRRTALVRRAAGRTSRAQVVVANVDVLLIVTSVGRDFNERRLERYLAAAWDSGARPVVVLNKIDLADDVTGWTTRVGQVALGVDVVGVSAQTGQGLEALSAYAANGVTLAFVGSSGVGKSSLVNRWLGTTVQATGALDALERGRHTTTRRSLLRLPTGAVLVDTPGMREFGLAEASVGIETTFDDVVALAAGCRFADCAHLGEPGCAVLQAVNKGELAAPRLDSYRKLQREALAMQARTDQRVAREIRQRSKLLTRAARAKHAAKGRG